MGLFGNKIDRVAKHGTWSEVCELAYNCRLDGNDNDANYLVISYVNRAIDNHYPDSYDLSSAFLSAASIYEKRGRTEGDRRYLNAAFKYYYAAATMGMYADEEAMYKVGYFYEKGYEEGGMSYAIKWYREAASHGSENGRKALYRLGY